jgi:Flp pilus assembly protein TadD
MRWFRRTTTGEARLSPESRWATVVRHEMVQLTVLIGVAVAAFLVTRAVAAGNRDIAAQDAEEWYRRATAATAAGEPDEAIEALRRAVARRRGDRTYALALARALAARGELTSARQQLVALRESAPEDPVVNLDLARLAARRGDAVEAQRFYYNALYAPWPSERADERRAVRMELIRLLVAHGEARRALSELLAISGDAPDDAKHQAEIGELFASAGDPRRALTHYRNALTHDPALPAALAGAGLAAFTLGDYRLARTYLHRTGETSGAVADTRQIVDFVLDGDPLAPRLGATERRRRVDTIIRRTRERLGLCTTAQPDASAATPASLLAALDALQLRVRPRQPIDQDTVEDLLDLTSRIEKYAAQRCAPAAPVDRALLIVALRHGAEGA